MTRKARWGAPEIARESVATFGERNRQALACRDSLKLALFIEGITHGWCANRAQCIGQTSLNLPKHMNIFVPYCSMIETV